jgi:hypothetical protein
LKPKRHLAASSLAPTNKIVGVIRPQQWTRYLPLTAIGVGTGVLYLMLAINQTAIWERASWFARPWIGLPATNRLLVEYAALNAGLMALYVIVLGIATARPIDRPTDRAMIMVTLGWPVAYMAGLLFFAPTFSIDALSYLAHGATALLPFPTDAYAAPPNMILALPYGQELVARGWVPPPGVSPYGPLWTLLESFVVRSGMGIDASVTLFKIVATGSALASGFVIWRILGLIRPAARLAGTAAFLWNPVVIMELAGDGHNDGLMVLLALLALYFVLSARAEGSLLASAIGSAVKYLPALFVLPQLAYMWQTASDRRRVVRGAAIGMLGGLVLGVLAFAPFAGPHVLDGVFRANGGGPWPLWPSISGLVYTGFQSWLPSFEPASGRTLLLLGFFALVVAYQTYRSSTPARLIGACSTIALTYVYLVSPAFWPWYAILPIAFLVLEGGWRPILIILVATVASRFVAPLGVMPTDVPFEMAWEIGTVGPLIVTCAVVAALRIVGPSKVGSRPETPARSAPQGC